jgi:hypothetical protein
MSKKAYHIHKIHESQKIVKAKKEGPLPFSIAQEPCVS